MGTEKYLAPENKGHAYGDDDLSARADDYSLALIAFEMLTLHHLKDTMPRSEWRGERRLPELSSAAFSDVLAPDTAAVASQVQDVLSKALDSVPMQRYATAEEFIQALEKISNSSSSAAPQKSPTAPQPPRSEHASHTVPTQKWPEPPRPTENMQPTGFVAPSNPISSTAHVRPSTPVTPPTPIPPQQSGVSSALSAPPKKDNGNALIITATVVVIILIFLVTWAIVA